MLMPLEELGESFRVYDFYGDLHTAQVSRPVTEPRWLVQTSSGEAFWVGQSHTFLCRKLGAAEYTRVPVTEVARDIVFVRMPQKKTTLDVPLFANLEHDEKRNILYLEAESVSELVTMAEVAATAGMSVVRHPTKRQIELEISRPVCFANKLLIGAFDNDLETALESLCASGVLMPWRMYGPEFVEETRKTGVIFEGNNVFSEIKIVKCELGKGEGQFRRVTLGNGRVPLETVWTTT